MKDYKNLATSILEKVGGKSNISYLVHCMTRLRFNLKDESLANQDDINAIPGVMGSLYQNGQLQIIIGETVPEVYDEVCKIAGIQKEAGIDEDLDRSKTAKKKFNVGAIFDVFSACFAPIVTAFAGAGVLKGVLILLTNYKFMTTDTGLYLILNAAADSVFYFLPFMLAFTSAKKFKTNEIMAMIIAGIYMYPTVLAGAGTQMDLFGFSFYLVKYASSVLPILASVWIMSFLYRFLTKHTPSFLRVVVVPVGVLLVMAPLSIVIIGPLGYNVGIMVGNAIGALFDFSPMLGGLIYGASRQLLVFTGTHMALSPIILSNLETFGFDVLSPVSAMSTMAVAGMCLGVFIKAKKEANKASSFSAFASSFIGVTEPALYGIAFRFKKPLIAVCIGGGISGAIVSAMGAKAIAFAMPSIISLPAYAGSIPTVLIGMAISFVITAIIAYFLGFDEGIEKDQRAIEAEKKNIFKK